MTLRASGLFEPFLPGHVSSGTRISTDDATPQEVGQPNREFLNTPDYEHVSGTHRIMAKEVTRK